MNYVADAEDENFLQKKSKFGAAAAAKAAEKKADGEGKTSSRKTPLPAPQLPLETFERMLDLLEKETGFDAIITVHQAEKYFLSKLPELLDIFPTSGRGVVTLKQVLQDVYAYWVSKRSKLKRPLLRHYWPVTSSDDTNPHLVFRPREKEKYKLRKKRQNDMEAFHKMKQLRNDFDNLRAVLDLVRRREELHRTQVQLQIELFQQRLYDAVDTSGVPRVSEQLSREKVKRALDVPIHFDLQAGGRKAKRVRSSDAADFKSALGTTTRASTAASSQAMTAGASVAIKDGTNIAGRNHGEPAPNFLHALETRETYATSWDNAVPYVTSYTDSHALPTFRFRHRPRVGRGGRVCIDRVPQPPLPAHVPPVTVLRAGLPLAQSLSPQERLLDLLPDPLDREALSRRIEEISAGAIKEDFEAKAMGGDLEENDGDEVIVRLDDYLETDDPVWGEERYAIGPI